MQKVEINKYFCDLELYSKSSMDFQLDFSDVVQAVGYPLIESLN